MIEDRTKPHILIVDDDIAMLQALPQMLVLRMQEIRIDTCDNAQEALENVQEHDYDAIISDIKIPGMDGLELLDKMREQRPDIPVLLITGHGEHSLAIQALRGGAYDYILKPIDRDTFTIAIERAVQTRQLRRKVTEQQVALTLHAKSLEQMVEKRTSELAALAAAKDKFLAIVSHELKTPLTSLKGRAQLLRRQLERPDAQTIVKQGLIDIERSVQRTALLVQDLLDTSLIETNMFTLHRKRCDLVELCRSLLDEYTKGAGPTLTCEFLGEPVEAEIDSDRMSQVIINLISNARKYSTKGSPITITLQCSGYEAFLSVRDVGVGIPPEALPHIFEQFYRAPGVEVQTGSHSGLGLGLYISRKIVERHGGSIEVQSVVGQGSTFIVTLPLFVDPKTEEMETTKFVPHTQAIWTMTH